MLDSNLPSKHILHPDHNQQDLESDHWQVKLKYRAWFETKAWVMSDLAKLIQTGRRSPTRQEEITEGKVWNPATQRYRQRLTPKEAYRQGLLYVSALNIYLDYTKFPNRCLEIEIEKQSRLVWYTASNHYCYKRSAEQEKEINVVYDFESNT